MRHRYARMVQGDGLRAKALRGSGWTLGGFVASQVARMASTVVLTRMLFPEAYGIMAMANVYMVGLQMFSDIGIRHSIIQHNRGEEPAFLNTAWTMQVVRGFVLWFVSCVIAYPVSRFYEEPVLFPVLCVLGFSAAIKGFQTTAYATANRRLALGRLTGMDLGTHVFGIVVTIVWAHFHPSVWALAGGGVITALISVASGFVVLPSHRHRLMWEKSAAQEIVRFGKWIFLATILGYFANNGDRLLLGKFMTTADFGMYALALTWAGLLSQVNNLIGDRVMLPIYAAYKEADPKVLRPKVSRMRVAKAMGLLPLSCFFIIAGGDIITLMYDPRYEKAGWMLQVLSAGIAFNLSMHIGEFYLARGRSGLFLSIVAMRSTVLLACMLLGGVIAGSAGVVFGVAASSLVQYPILASVYRRFGLWIWRLDAVFGLIVGLSVGVAIWRVMA